MLEVNPAQQAEFATSDAMLTKLFQLGMSIEKHFGCPQDIELVISKGNIIVTQTRPITT
jgi:pyruvate,water dikinase